jgi:hypothetical protein
MERIGITGGVLAQPVSGKMVNAATMAYWERTARKGASEHQPRLRHVKRVLLAVHKSFTGTKATAGDRGFPAH